MPDYNSTTVKHALDANAGLDHADAVWELLAARIDLLVAAWEQGTGPPALGDFAPADPPNVRRLALCELAKIDMEYRFAQGFAWKVEDYLRHFPDLAAGGQLPCDLIYEEYHLRRKSGEAVAASEYLTRFPVQADELRRLLDSPSMDRTTSLFVPVVSAGLEVGETIDDFDLLTQLGKGAFATVYLARQRSLQRLVALKASADAGSEPQTLAQLDHPHIVRVYDQRLVPDRDLRLLYMQYVPGGTLQDVIRRAKDAPPAERNGHVVLKAVDAALDKAGQGPPSDSSARQSVRNCSWPQVVCRLGQQLGSALDYAHRRGVLHRDLKPANVLMTAEGSPRLADFNISFCSKLDGASPAAYFGGSLAYMSPEQLEACSPQFERQPDSLDGRSDVYALGVVLWELLTGNRPFADEPLEAGWGATVEAMVARRQRGIDAGMLKTLPADLPPGLVDVLVDCLAPDAEQRPATAAEAAARLRLCQHPDAQRLLDGPNRGWRGAAQRFCVLAVVLIALVFNGVAAPINYFYNTKLVPDSPYAKKLFWFIQGVTNGIAFPVGVAVLVMMCWPVQRALWGVKGAKGLKSGKGKEEDLWRLRALRLGHLTAVLGIVEWLLAGFSYPLAMYLAGVRLGPAEAIHFVISLALCGLIAATYPFFAITFLGVRAFYVGLLPGAAPGAADADQLTRLARYTWRYLVLAATVPMLAIVLLVLLGGLLGGTQDRLPLFVLSAGSLVGFGLIFYLARAIQADIQTLQWIVNPPSNAETSESDSFILPR